VHISVCLCVHTYICIGALMSIDLSLAAVLFQLLYTDDARSHLLLLYTQRTHPSAEVVQTQRTHTHTSAAVVHTQRTHPSATVVHTQRTHTHVCCCCARTTQCCCYCKHTHLLLLYTHDARTHACTHTPIAHKYMSKHLSN
jgi:hypothetical protein